MSKKIKRRIYTLLIVSLIGYIAWYGGNIPFTLRNQVRSALGIPYLHPSISIGETYTDAWTDYIFEAELTFSPSSLRYITSGRKFSTHKYTELDYEPEHIGSTGYSWSSSEAGSARCYLLVDKSNSKASLTYSAN
ncbi:hypothetical protein [Rubritalea sp.]|uniref:hypothetical protein n=1 Tax=Rubritalea sp. TaxID=2109375 RepID=UPI003EF60ABF